METISSPINLLIIALITYSYYVGAKAIKHNDYSPSIYSRVIWFLIAANTMMSIVALQSSFLILIYGLAGVVGNFVILLLSIKNSPRVFGNTEKISSALLAVSFALWVFAQIPLLNLTIGLIAHLIGGLPTIKRAVLNPSVENVKFWLYFCLASILTVIVSFSPNIKDYLYPLYFSLFDGLMVILCAIRYRRRLSIKPLPIKA